MHDKIQRYSLRKLSIGLASVLVGACIFGVNGKTVKADVTSDQTAQLAKIQDQTAPTQPQEKTQTSSAQNSIADQPQKNLLEIPMQSNDRAEVQKNKLADQSDSMLTNQDNTDSNQNLERNKVASDETKQDAAIKSDTDKSITKPSLNQKSDNQSNDHAEDNSQTQLNITKNSQPLARKALATNLIQDDSTQDVSKITNPSEIDVSHFADGTRWTPAGWTRTDKNTKVAKQSSITVNTNLGNNFTIEPTKDLNAINVTDLKFTLDKNDLKAGNKILVATIQQIPTNAKQDVSTDDKQPCLSTDRLESLNVSENILGQKVGTLTASNLDNGEIDFYFNVTKDVTNLVDDPFFDTTMDGDFFTTNRHPNYEGFYSYKNNLQYPLHYSVVTNSKIINYNIRRTPIDYADQTQKYNTYWVDGNWNTITFYCVNRPNELNGIQTINGGFVFKVETLQGQKPDLTKISGTFTTQANLLDANKKLLNDIAWTSGAWNPTTILTDSLSALDLWNSTVNNTLTASKQNDGSFLICFKPPKTTPTINRENLRKAAEGSATANISDHQHYQEIIDNTVNIKAPSVWQMNISLKTPLVDNVYQVTDLTPTGVNFNKMGPQILKNGSSGSSSVANIETYKHVAIQYLDDDNSKSVSSDTMTGRQNKASTYTVNIPKGYYLDDSNTSTGYTWNTDHTAIFYTFNEDQAKNDANPIEIHLRHKHTAVTDSSQLHATGKRTITIYLPHQDQPMIIVQTVGWQRTGDLDEATNTPTYTDWKVDAGTSNVTVDGQVSTQYQAYVLKDSVVNYALIKLPHLNGYKAKLIQDKANPAMFFVSFFAVPQHSSNEAQPSDNVQSPRKPIPTKQKQPEPIQTRPADDKQAVQIFNHILYAMKHDFSDNSDSLEPAQNDTDQLENPSDSTRKDDTANPKKANVVKHKKRVVKKHAIKRRNKHAKYHLKRRSRKRVKHAKKRIIKHRKNVSKKFRKYNLKHVKKA